MTPHKCPLCDGAGTVSRPPWVAGDQNTWVGSGNVTWPCRAGEGTSLVFMQVGATYVVPTVTAGGQR